VHPGLVQAVEASLTEAAGYVKPDDAIEAGGCIVDLRNGTIDATLDTRLSLMDLALREAGGEVQL
jgi:flagellar biosynthesis/type III secretory pathway protein FliH